ncbi:hypothetical protein JTE90_019281 [Oedothorax gibbosus]|uniref:Uncharacterized protein n=1 Tax=Oedothorax gibbosus TaxID=931172 RepID=A0AAV6UVN1_9ARAC|nr:hypothetical protein JTE90_019281 [Oedothorax gibbosus]
MQVYFILFVVALFGAGNCGNNDAKKIACIHGKFNNDIGSAGYTNCHQRSGALPIPRIKQCYQEVMKTAQVVVTVGGKQKVDGTKFAEYAAAHSTSDVGKAMGACSRKTDAQEIYKKASSTTQCVFSEVKRTCK